MIKEALEYIVGLTEPYYKELNGHTYSDTDMTRLDIVPYASKIEMNTLTSLVDYIKSGVDTMKEKMIVHVVSPTEVRLYSCLDNDRKRENMVTVNAMLPTFRFGDFIDHEDFCINLQSKFIDNYDRRLVLKFAGTVETGTVSDYSDDGVSQKATVKDGISSKTDAVVPNPVNLIPYRTFIEVDQPASDFVFRMKADKYDGIKCAVFEADGGAWKNEAMQNIKDYIGKELVDCIGITVIS